MKSMKRLSFSPLIYRTQKLKKPLEQLSDLQKDALNRFSEKVSKGYYKFEKSSCLCGKEDGALISSRDRYTLPVNTNLCRACGSMWTTPRMTEDTLSNFYEEDYRPIYVGAEESSDDFFTNQINQGEKIYRFTKPYIKDAKEFKVFDIGCGAGGVLIPFKKSGCQTFGSDLGSQYLQRGRDEGLTLENGEAVSLRQYGSANLIILSHVLEHFPYPLKSIQEIASLLVDEGYVYVELPGVFSIHKTYGDTLLFLQNAHLYHFTLNTLASLMAKAGFKLVQGDESICALFQKTNSVIETDSTNQYQKVLRYLYFVEIERIFHVYRMAHRVSTIFKRRLKLVLGQDFVNKLKQTLSWL